MRTTLRQAKDFGINNAVGLATCDARFVAMLNEAQQRLLNCGRWWGTYKRMRICVTDGCIVWPAEVASVEALSVCDSPAPIRNAWYEFQSNVFPSLASSCQSLELIDRGTVPVHTNVSSDGNYIQINIASSTDAGKTIVIQGTDSDGNPVRTLCGSDWIDGECVTLAYPSTQTATRWNADGITAVQKDKTNSTVTLYEYDGVNAVTSDDILSTYSAWETNPDYRKTYVENLPDSCCSQTTSDVCGESSSCSDSVKVTAIVRVAFVPASVDADWLVIGNLPALKHEMKAVYFENQKEYQLAEVEHQKALKRLREELDSMTGGRERATVNVNLFGTAPFRNVTAGFI